jgi:peptidyl-tRNA hydrolase, PTH1 family
MAMKIIVGLGNVGDKYTQTRHNAGFLALNKLSDKLGLEWDSAGNKSGDVAMSSDKQLWLFKPGLYMNNSGQAWNLLTTYYKLPVDKNVLVVHDDLDLPWGVIRETVGGGAGGHNGVISLRQSFTEEDWGKVQRLRMGVGRPSEGVTDSEIISNWVLSRVSEDDHDKWVEMLENAAGKIQEWVRK